MKILSDDGIDIWFEMPCGTKTVISKEDEWIFSVFTCFGITGSRSKYVFASRQIDTEYSKVTERVYLHKIIINLKNRKGQIDHKDRDRLNNRRSNLRIANVYQNMANVGPRLGKKYKGVFLDKKRANSLQKPYASYIAYIDAKNGGLQKRKYIGRFSNEKEAAIAYNKAAKEIYGEFAYQNDIEDQTESTSKIINAAPAL